jgi:gamma-butyrobetaine dioxygenase
MMRTVDDVASLYSSAEAARPYDEAVSELEHGLQAAALAARSGAPDHLIAAALLHDVGHLLLADHRQRPAHRRTDEHHERAGAAWLAGWFGPEVTAPVAGHVAAKRYLCAVDPAYLGSLSSASQHTLALQGGVMSADEVRRCADRRSFVDAVAVRRWDDAAKVPGREVPSFDDYLPLLVRLRRRR